MASLFEIYNFARNASIDPETPTSWMFVKNGKNGWNGWTTDENSVRMMEKVGSLIAFRFDNGEKTAGMRTAL